MAVNILAKLFTFTTTDFPSPQKETPYLSPVIALPQLLATTNLLSTSMNLPNPDISRQWNRTIHAYRSQRSSTLQHVSPAAAGERPIVWTDHPVFSVQQMVDIWVISTFALTNSAMNACVQVIVRACCCLYICIYTHIYHIYGMYT